MLKNITNQHDTEHQPLEDHTIEMTHQQERDRRQQMVDSLKGEQDVPSLQSIEPVVLPSQTHQQLGRNSMIRLNIDTTSKKKMNVIFGVLSILIIISYIATSFVPQTFIQIDDFEPSCPFPWNQYPNYCQALVAGNFGKQAKIFRDMKMTNQHILVTAHFERNLTANNADSFEEQVEYRVTLVHLGPNMEMKEVKVNNKLHSEPITCDNLQRTASIATGKRYPYKKSCSSVNVLYIDKIYSQNYFFMIELVDPSKMSQYFKSIFLEVTTMNPPFIDFVLVLRYSCLVITLIMGLWYYSRMKKLQSEEWVLTQKMLMIMCPLLFLFNDPFIGVTFLKPNEVSAFFSTLWQTMFVSYFMFFLVVSFHSIMADTNQKSTVAIDRYKILVCCLFLVVSLIFNFQMSLYFYKDPSFRPLSDDLKPILVGMFFYIMSLIAYMCLLLNYYCKACIGFRTLLNRHQVFFLFSSFFTFSLSLFLIVNSYHVHFLQSQRLLLTIVITNLYVWFLLYFYVPSRKGLMELQQSRLYNQSLPNHNQIYQHLQDNQDSEEEVVFTRHDPL